MTVPVTAFVGCGFGVGNLLLQVGKFALETNFFPVFIFC
jgi:hypothetical protein